MNVEEGAGAVKKRVRRKNRCLQRKTDSEHHRYDVKYGEIIKNPQKSSCFLRELEEEVPLKEKAFML